MSPTDSLTSAARSILAARRRWWQYELLGQMISDAIDQVRLPEYVAPREATTEAVSLTMIAARYKEILAGSPKSLLRLTHGLGDAREKIHSGDIAEMSKFATLSVQTYLQAKRYWEKANELPTEVICPGVPQAWAQELTPEFVELKEQVCNAASYVLTAHEGIGERYVAEVRQARQRAIVDPCAGPELYFSYKIEVDSSAVHRLTERVDEMGRIANLIARVKNTTIALEAPQAGRLCLSLNLSRPNVVKISAGATHVETELHWKTSSSLTIPFVTIFNCAVSDYLRAERCAHALLEPFRISNDERLYEIQAAQAVALMDRIGLMFQCN